MNIKTELKKIIGKSVSINMFEKLTEYSIWQNAKGFNLSGASLIKITGNSWEELIARGRERLWKHAVESIKQPDILFLEFGVWQGESMKFFGQLIKSNKSIFLGFDSFRGLPEQWRGMQAGNFSTEDGIPKIDDPRVTFIKGWFQDTLPGRLDEIVNKSVDRTVLVHFDADLYSSTLYLLFRLTQKIRNFYFIFDEFSGHETRALYNFVQSSGAKVEFIAYITWEDCPAVVFGKLSLSA